MTAHDLGALLAKSRCVVVVGPGGVGKTSTSAAIAIEAARQGRRTVVLTIDPARRLANALGLPEIGNEEKAIGAEAFLRAGLEVPGGRLTAMMLDIKQAWDEVIRRYHPDPELKRELLANRLYVAMSTALAGSQEYMAMEKLHDLACREVDRPEVIVLDTPPSNHAVDFLEAPAKLLDALDNDATRWLLEPFQQRGRMTRRLLDAGSSLVIRALSRFTGAELLEELAGLLTAFQAMFDGFKERARAVRAVLEAEGTTFLVVGGPTPAAVEETRAFRERLLERRVSVGAMIANRAMPPVFGEASPPAPAVLAEAVRRAGGDDRLRVRLEEVARALQEEAQLHEAAVAALRARASSCPVVVTPQLPRDIHDLAGLDVLRRHLFAAGAGPA